MRCGKQPNNTILNPIFSHLVVPINVARVASGMLKSCTNRQVLPFNFLYHITSKQAIFRTFQKENIRTLAYYSSQDEDL
jgi:hypothetical protein